MQAKVEIRQWGNGLWRASLNAPDQYHSAVPADTKERALYNLAVSPRVKPHHRALVVREVEKVIGQPLL